MPEKKEPDSPHLESLELESLEPKDPNDLSEPNLPEVRGQVPYKVWLVQGLYLLERAAFYGLSQILRMSILYPAPRVPYH